MFGRKQRRIEQLEKELAFSDKRLHDLREAWSQQFLAQNQDFEAATSHLRQEITHLKDLVERTSKARIVETLDLGEVSVRREDGS